MELRKYLTLTNEVNLRVMFLPVFLKKIIFRLVWMGNEDMQIIFFIERLWRTIKQEEVYLREYNSPIEAMISLKKYMIFYNSQRPHQSLGYKTPKEVYEESLRKLQNLKI